MPGGLTRVSSASDSLVVSMQRGGGSKDTWVSCEQLPLPLTLLRPAGAPIELSRGGTELPSRVADNLFWLGRYMERVEGTARIARGVLSRISDESSETEAVLEALLAALVRHIGLETPVDADEDAFLAVLFGEAPARSLRATLAAIHQLAFSLRDQISLDTWRIVNQLDRTLPRLPASGRLPVASV